MAQINWTSQALQDLELIADFIGRDTSSFAQVIVDRVFESVERFENFSRSRLNLHSKSRISSVIAQLLLHFFPKLL